jgi:hypothetical protein
MNPDKKIFPSYTIRYTIVPVAPVPRIPVEDVLMEAVLTGMTERQDFPDAKKLLDRVAH